MKAALLTALAVPLMFAASAPAHADPGDPPPIFTPDEQCATAKEFVDTVRRTDPGAPPDRIADTYVRIMDQHNAYRGDTAARDRDRQYLLDTIARCGAA
ncbi:hypothetical protein [Nocardia veterana]|uniref:Hemophore-related protein n=1 Tax=Nocardia veterana TaxID=132249 RepID=A0A7X6LTA6_9NOCA|nr:hypothetical protein [Nocardia veterana]NKY84191.1 hypothetical protein [Nocardia veterana]